jgi:hypothetical protein
MSKIEVSNSFKDSKNSLYPKSKDVFKFDKEFSRYFIWKQEFDLRNELGLVSKKKDILSKIGLGQYISEDIASEFNSEISYIFRYKRLNDILYDAANIGAKTEKRTGINLGQTLVKNIATKSQIDTMIKHSLDTPYILYHILKNNNFTDKFSKEENKHRNFSTTNGKIRIGRAINSIQFFGSDNSETDIYLNDKGDFVSGSDIYIPLGIAKIGAKKGKLGFKGKQETPILETNITQDTISSISINPNFWDSILNTASSSINYISDNFGLPSWSADPYLISMIKSEELSNILHNDIAIYFRKQKGSDKEDTNTSYKLICKGKSKPNRKSIKDLSKELKSGGGKQNNRKTFKRNSIRKRL